jgi:hypothetical protein
MTSELVDAPAGKRFAGRSAYAWALVALALLAVLVLHALMYSYDHDEEQYVAAGVLARHLTLYKDFIYLQVPYYASVLAAVYSPLEGHFFLAGRLFTAVLSLSAVLAFFLVARRLASSLLAAALVTFVFCTSDAALHVFGLVRNDALPLLLGLLSLLTALMADTQSGRRGLWILSGVLAAGALGSKVSWVFLPIGMCIFLAARLVGGRSKAGWMPLLCYGAGGLLGIMPVAWFAAASPENFLYSNLSYHMTAPRIWYDANGAHEWLDPWHHLLRFSRLLVEPAIGVAGLCVLALVALLARSPAVGVRRLWQSDRLLLPLVLLLVAVVFAYLPRPAQLQYTAPVVALLFLVVAALQGIATETQSYRPAGFVWIAFVVLGSFKGMYTLGMEAARFPDGPVRQFAGYSRLIRETVPRESSRPIATMSPIQVLDAGLTIYPELASGPFFFRSANDLPDGKIRSLKGLAPKMLDEFLDQDPPAAILVGYEYSWSHALAWGPDESLERYARSRNFHESPGELGTGRVYVPGTARE